MLSSATALLDPLPFTLNDGTRVIIRPIQPQDADSLQATFKRFSLETIYQRFHSIKKELPDDEARQLATVDYRSRMAFVAVCQEQGREIVIGVSRYSMIENSHNETAESAVVVADEYQRRGLGKLLLWRLVLYARAMGLRYLRGNLQIGNDRMLTLVHRSGLPHQQRYVDGLWEITIDLVPPEAEE